MKLPEHYTEETFQEALLRAEMLIDSCLAEASTLHIPKLDIAQINSLPWKKRNKEPAKPGEFAWLFGPGSRDGTEQGAEKLVGAIRKAGSKLQLGDVEYSLVKREAFIQRRPVKS